MRGVIFTELIEFVEEALGFEVADKMIEKAHLGNEGVFSQGGNYPFNDMQKILMALSEITGKKPNELLYLFGKHLFSILVRIYGHNIKNIGNSLDFIDSVDKLVHAEVKKLYPDAELPTFTTIEKNSNLLIMIYKSEKRLESFAHGLIVACGKYFDDELNVSYETISQNPYEVKFIIKKNDNP